MNSSGKLVYVLSFLLMGATAVGIIHITKTGYQVENNAATAIDETFPSSFAVLTSQSSSTTLVPLKVPDAGTEHLTLSFPTTATTFILVTTTTTNEVITNSTGKTTTTTVLTITFTIATPVPVSRTLSTVYGSTGTPENDYTLLTTHWHWLTSSGTCITFVRTISYVTYTDVTVVTNSYESQTWTVVYTVTITRTLNKPYTVMRVLCRVMNGKREASMTSGTALS